MEAEYKTWRLVEKPNGIITAQLHNTTPDEKVIEIANILLNTWQPTTAISIFRLNKTWVHMGDVVKE